MSRVWHAKANKQAINIVDMYHELAYSSMPQQASPIRFNRHITAIDFILIIALAIFGQFLHNKQYV
jgi:hypothetical protein